MKTTNKTIIALSVLLAVSCTRESIIPPTGNKTGNASAEVSTLAVSDPAANTVTIGTQTWMLKNLTVTKYRNGDPIPYVPYVAGDKTWSTLTTGAWCYYNNDAATAGQYGLLYNAYAMLDPRGLAPAGWHIPSTAEFTVLTDFLGGPTIAGGKMKAVTNLWRSPNTGATNASGFTGLPGGYRLPNLDGKFNLLHDRGLWWTTMPSGTSSYYVKFLAYNSDNLTSLISSKNNGVSVRCIKN